MSLFYWKIPLNPFPLRKENRELLPAASGRLLLPPSLPALDDELDCPFLLWCITPGERKRRERSAARRRCKQKQGDKLVIFIVSGCRGCVVKILSFRCRDSINEPRQWTEQPDSWTNASCAIVEHGGGGGVSVCQQGSPTRKAFPTDIARNSVEAWNVLLR